MLFFIKQVWRFYYYDYLISIWQKLNESVEARVRDLFDGRGATADGLDRGRHARLVVARDVRLKLAKDNPERNETFLL